MTVSKKKTITSVCIDQQVSKPEISNLPVSIKKIKSLYAAKIKIQISMKDGNVILLISDNGAGCDTKKGAVVWD